MEAASTEYSLQKCIFEKWKELHSIQRERAFKEKGDMKEEERGGGGEERRKEVEEEGSEMNKMQ